MPDGEDYLFSRYVCRFAGRVDLRRKLAVRARDPLHGRAGVDLNTLLFEGFASEGRNLLVFDRQHPVEHLDHGDLGAHIAIKAGELDPDRPRADDQQRFRDRRGNHRLLIGPHLLAIGFEARQ